MTDKQACIPCGFCCVRFSSEACRCGLRMVWWMLIPSRHPVCCVAQPGQWQLRLQHRLVASSWVWLRQEAVAPTRAVVTCSESGDARSHAQACAAHVLRVVWSLALFAAAYESVAMASMAS